VVVNLQHGLYHLHFLFNFFLFLLWGKMSMLVGQILLYAINILSVLSSGEILIKLVVSVDQFVPRRSLRGVLPSHP